MALRLIDIHSNWLWQYASDTSTFDPGAYAEIPARLKQQTAYLTATSAAVLCAGRLPADWQGQADPWRSLGELITRYESEFAGRLLFDRSDLDRWNSEPPEALTWGILGVSGLDYLIREQTNLARLLGLFNRGVHVIQLVETFHSLLAGSADAGDDRGLTELGRACLTEIAALATGKPSCPLPIIDLAQLNQRSRRETLDALEGPASLGRVLLMYSHGAIAHPGFDGPRALDVESLTRLRARGGLVGLTPAQPFYQTPEDFKAAVERVAAIPLDGSAGYQGIAIGCDFLEWDQSLPGLGDAEQIVAWLSQSFESGAAALLIEASARRFFTKALGGGLRRPAVAN